jgi:PAS domain S-box-containing protein
VRSLSLKTQIVALAACAVLGVAAVAVAGALVLHRGAARALLAEAPERLGAVWRAEAAPLAETARRLAADPAIARADGAALADAFRAAVGRAPGSGDLLRVTGADGRAAAWPGPEAADLDPAPGAGVALAGGAPVLYATAPRYPARPDGPRVVVARKAGPERLAAWERAAGGRLSLSEVPPPAPPGRLGAPAAVWAVAEGGPWAVVAPPGLRDAFGPAFAPLLGLLALVAFLAVGSAAILAEGVGRALRAVETGAARVAAGEAPPPMPPAGPEIEAVARAVARIREALDRQDRALKESAHRLRILQEEAVDALFLFDRTGRIQDVNAKAVALTGFDREALLKRDVVTCVVDERPLQEEMYRRFIACLDGTPAVFETRFATADGESVPVEVSAGPIPHLAEPVVQALVRDMAERRRLEAQLAQAEKMEGIGTLAGGIAHDFNNILSGILGYAALIKAMVPEGERVHRYTDIIERSATRGAELTQQLLGYARGGKYQVARVRLNDVAQEVVALLRGGLADRGITVDARLDHHLPAVEADAGQIHQVLSNLCINARDAMPEGGRLRLVSEAVDLQSGDPEAPPGLEPGRFVRLTVADTGHGMAPDVQRRMFEPFFTTKAPGEGTGLGLAMVYGIVKNHGGQITVASRPGQGTAVRVWLPALEGTVQVLPRKAQPVRGGAETILVVDDEVTILELAREILRGRGYAVVLARNGEEAVHVYRQYGESIPLVVLDIVMPRMGGKETYRRLKELNPRLKVVVSSGFSRHGQAHDLLEMGADAFVQKPYRPDDLAAVVRRTLDAPPDARAQSA